MAKSYLTKDIEALNSCWLNKKLTWNSNVEKNHLGLTKMATKIQLNRKHYTSKLLQ